MHKIHRLTHQLFDIFQNLVLLRVFRYTFELSQEALSPAYEVKAVETADEYFEALGLLHKCYVEKGLMAEDPRGIRLLLHHLLPETNIIMVKHNGVCVGTGTLIHKGDLPFPVAKAFSEETKKTLAKYRDILEFSGLAVHPDYRAQGNAIQLLMIKFFFQLSNRIYENPYTVCSLHPKAERFYSTLVGFKRTGPVLNYDFVSGAKAIYMEGSMSIEDTAAREGHFAGKSERENFSRFLQSPDPRMVFPSLDRHIHFGRDLLKNLLDDIFPRLLDDASYLLEAQLRVIHEVKQIIGGAKPGATDVRFIKALRPYRLRTNIPCSFGAGDLSESSVVNMNEHGVLIRMQKLRTLEALDKLRELTLKINETEYKFHGTPVRIQFEPTGIASGASAPEGQTEAGGSAEIGFKLVGGNEILSELLSQETTLKTKAAVKKAA